MALPPASMAEVWNACLGDSTVQLRRPL